MTISVEGLINKSKDAYKLVLLPQDNSFESDTKTIYTTFTYPHPVTGISSDFVVEQYIKDNKPQSQLYILDQINWKNINVKNQAYTPDGKPYRCIFITKNIDKTVTTTSNEVPALVLGTEPNLYILTPFLPLYFLLDYFKPILQKKVLNGKIDDNNDKRLLSYEDLTDSIYESIPFIENISKNYNIDLKPSLETICESSSIPSMDSDDENEEQFFYKISLEKIKKLIIKKIDGLVEMFMTVDSFKSLKIRMETMYPNGVPDNIKLIMWQQQAITLLANYIDKWYIDLSTSYNTDSLEKFIKEMKVKNNAQDMIDESIQQLHEGTAAVLAAQKNKKAKTIVKKPTKATPKTVPVAVGKGKLDMFFKKKA